MSSTYPSSVQAASMSRLIVLIFLILFFAGECHGQEREDLASRPRKVVELIEYWGYEAETHWITTADGYILTVHRIPVSSNDDGRAVNASRPIAFLLHGIFGTSARWTLGPPDKSLAFILADRGYDVWMGNTRGNTYSRNHTTLDPDSDQRFWDFDIEAAAVGDLIACFDYIYSISETDGPFFYICHSMGCAEILILLSEKPEYNDLLDAVFLMAPPAFMGNSKASFLSKFAGLAESYIGYKELRKAKTKRNWMARTKCSNWVCHVMAAKMLSVGYSQLNMTMLPVILDHTSHGSSSKVVFHFAQLARQGNVFRKYDYGEKKNPKYYDGSLVPPDYLIENITAPIYIFYGNGDKLIITKDVKMLSNALPSLEMMYEVNYTGWNHNDFVYAIDAKNLVYDIIISHMNDYRNNATISMEP